MKIVSVAEMRKIEEAGFARGISGWMMMETAGEKLADCVMRRYAKASRILLIAGKGNNGGDGLIAARKLAENGRELMVWVFSGRNDNQGLEQDFARRGIQIIHEDADARFERLSAWVAGCDLILDGALGIGCKLPLKFEIKQVLQTVKKGISERGVKPVIVAVDCPSGLDCDSGQVDEDCLAADLTVTFERAKVGALVFPGNAVCGQIEVVSLNLPETMPIYSTLQCEFAEARRIKSLLPLRPADGNKGTFGNATIIGGCRDYLGAPFLAGISAARSGCGYATFFVPEEIIRSFSGAFPCAIWTERKANDKDGWISFIEDQMKKFGKRLAFVVGPGLGQSEDSFFLFETILREIAKSDAPALMDADALNLMAKKGVCFAEFHEKMVITPHPGEMARLTNLSIEEIQHNRLKIAEKYSREWGVTLVLKGANTIVAAPGGQICIFPFATSALAKAGSGDALAGIIGSFLAQGLPPMDAACLGCWIHGSAGLIAEAEHGNAFSVITSDIIERIPSAISNLANMVC